MSEPQYKIRFNDHGVHEALEQAREALTSLSDDQRKEAVEGGHDPDDWLSRLEPAFDHLGALLGAADPALVNISALDSIQQQLEQITTSLNALRENQEWAQLQTVQSAGESLLNTTMQFAPAVGVWTDSDLKNAASKLGEGAAAKSRSLQGQLSNLKGRLDQLKDEADQAFVSLEEKAAERNTQADTQLENLGTEVSAEKTRIDEAISKFETDFNSSQEERGTLFAQTRKELDEMSKEAIDALKVANEEAAADEKERAEKAIENLEAGGESIIDFLNEKKDQAAKLIDLVATSSTAGAFGDEAKEQREAADRWRKGAVALATVAVAIGLIVVGLSFVYHATTAEQIGKALTVAVLLAVAGYAANQSSQHRRREQRAKRLELELVAFGPFTEPLDPAEQNQVRKELIERMFVGDPGDEGAHSTEETGISDEQFNLFLQAFRLFKESQK
jgi:hypothetical protein